MSDLPLFLGRMLRRPHQVVALAPSSTALARAMAAEVPEGTKGCVVELGAGTGKITKALLERGIAPEDLNAFELNPEFALYLHKRFPDVHVHNTPAQWMRAMDLGPLRAVVSGLPLLSMPNRVQSDILEASFDTLQPGGCFIQFTYGPTPPVSRALRERLGLSWTRSDRIWGNLPPARVYTFRRQLN